MRKKNNEMYLEIVDLLLGHALCARGALFPGESNDREADVGVASIGDGFAQMGRHVWHPSKLLGPHRQRTATKRVESTSAGFGGLHTVMADK